MHSTMSLSNQFHDILYWIIDCTKHSKLIMFTLYYITHTHKHTYIHRDKKYNNNICQINVIDKQLSTFFVEIFYKDCHSQILPIVFRQNFRFLNVRHLQSDGSVLNIYLLNLLLFSSNRINLIS